MKKLLIAVALLFTLSASAQTAVTKDSKTGNYYAITPTKVAQAGKATGSNFIDSKGVSYPVYESSKGKLYYLRIAKTSGKEYKVYIQEGTEVATKK